MPLRRSLPALLAVLATAALLAGCGGGGSNQPTAASTPAPSGGSSGGGGKGVQIDNFKFVPGTLTVKRGTRVVVANQDSTAHTATSDDGSSFDTGGIDPGASKTITLSKAGTFAYHCSIHPFMHGTLVVR
jgi:plastocyanin